MGRSGVPEDPSAPDVFAYEDVRAFLADLYAYKKANRRGFSYRAFARRVGLGSPNHLKRVIDGACTLSPEMAVRYARALRLRDHAVDYFLDLAALHRASSAQERDAAYRGLLGHRAYHHARTLDAAHAAYFSTWYMPAIRELVRHRDFRDDPAWMAAQLRPAIDPTEAARALRALQQLGLLQRRDGKLVQADRVVTTGPHPDGEHIRAYHRVMMERAVQSMDLVAAHARDISSVTLCAKRSTIALIHERVRRFRQELLALAAADDHGDGVLQVNIQVFPLSRPKKMDPDVGSRRGRTSRP